MTEQIFVARERGLAQLQGFLDHTLAGHVEEILSVQSAINQENASRLRSFFDVSGQALVNLGLDLIDIFVPGAGLVTRAVGFDTQTRS